MYKLIVTNLQLTANNKFQISKTLKNNFCISTLYRQEYIMIMLVTIIKEPVILTYKSG